MSYYYGGLNDEQLNEVFNILEKDKDRKEEYGKWIRYIPNTDSIDNSIKVYESLNLSDYTQKILFLFPLLRKHPLVVNYWASHVLFPNEAIEFDGKISKYFVLYIFNGRGYVSVWTRNTFIVKKHYLSVRTHSVF